MNSAIIVAAGSGKRFGGEKPKQFLELLGKPVLVHTFERFAACPHIDQIILVLPASEIENFKTTSERFRQSTDAKFQLKKPFLIIAGGETRAESVFRGLNHVRDESIEIVAVHDGARPLISVEEISAAIEKAAEIGAACLVSSVNDTIKEVSDGKIVGTIDRARLKRALTPQCFRREILLQAFEEVDWSAATDECSLVEKLGYEIALVEGSARNIKITTPEDMRLAEFYLQTEKTLDPL